MSRSYGYKRFEEIVDEDGEKYFIQVNKETGAFLARIPNPDPDRKHHALAVFEGKDLEQVRADLKAWLKDNATLKWEPVVIIKGREKRWGSSPSKTSLDLDYKRFFRAQRKDGSFIWKHFNSNNGTPGPNTDEVYLTEDRKVLKYSDQLWLGLETISELMRQMNDRIQGLIDSNEIEGMLIAISQRGTRALLGPKEEKAEAKA
jgi:hypothetical protein